MRPIELRSDTFTLPDEAMREVMHRAPLGDDVWGEDPSINALQEMAAARVGKEAALFVPSGSMANLVSLMAQGERGDEYIVGGDAHVFVYEAGSPAVVGGLHPYTVPNNADGTMDLDLVEAAIRPADSHFARSRLLCLESTHNRCWGSPLSMDYIDEARALADRHELKLHLDGARIFNASVALGVPVADMAARADSLSFCLSKGLGAPVGSLVCGSREFIDRCHRLRKVLGGGMRQAGMLAAAGMYALEHNVERLVADHAKAKRLADGIAAIEGLGTEPERVRSNIVYLDLLREDLSVDDLVNRCAERGLLFLHETGRRLRMVTHMGVDAEQVEEGLGILAEAMALS
jgi:threonine aldolase